MKALVLGCVLAGSQVAVAEPLTIAIAGEAPGIQSALAPYAPRIVTSDETGSLDTARAIAKRERAHLVVWFAARKVVVYDAASDRVVERVMRADWQPDDAGALEAARAVRVIVRTHRLGRARPIARLPERLPPAVVLPAPALVRRSPATGGGDVTGPAQHGVTVHEARSVKRGGFRPQA